MTEARFLSRQQQEAFEHWGVVRLPGLFDAALVRRARDHLLRCLAAVGVSEAGRWRLPEDDVDGKTAELFRPDHPAFAALDADPRLLAAVDELLGHRPRLDARKQPPPRNPQLLVTLPSGEAWQSISKAWRTPKPNGWHVDAQRLPSGQSLGLQVFGFLGAVGAGGGGTLVVAGSHRLLNDGRYIRLKDVGPQLRQEDYFRRLYDAGPDDLASAMARPSLVGGFGQQVVELTGEPGDAFVTDLRVLHSRAPNTGERLRLMTTHRFFRADLLQEVRDNTRTMTSEGSSP